MLQINLKAFFHIRAQHLSVFASTLLHRLLGNVVSECAPPQKTSICHTVHITGVVVGHAYLKTHKNQCAHSEVFISPRHIFHIEAN